MWRIVIKVILRIFATGYVAVIALLAVPGFAGLHVEAVTSGSMEPVIPVGAVVYVRQVSFSKIREGDVITYYLDESMTKVTHRVIKKYEKASSFVTKGDANQLNDAGNVLYENVEGKVIFSIPLLGRVAILLTDIYGKVLLSIGMLVLFALDRAISGQCGQKKGEKNADE